MDIYFFKIKKLQGIMIFLTLLLLSGCGPQNTSVPPPSGKRTATSIAQLTPLGASSGPSPLGTSISFDLNGWLHVQSASGFTCSAAPYGPPGLLVLPTVEPTYDQGTLQSVQNYITTLYNNPGDIGNISGDTPHHRDTVPYPVFSANSNAFQLLAVGSFECDEFLQITNIKTTPVQVNPISVTLTADTQKNTQHYNLIDECSLLSPSPRQGCGPQIGGSSSLDEIRFDLHPGKKNTVIPAYTQEGFGDNSFVLSSGEVAEVVLVYDAGPQDSFSFSLMPSFSLGLPGAESTTYPVPQLQETFTFALASQYACYSLQGQQFVKLSSFAESSAWCV